MEKKKLLLVAVSVGVFLTIVISASVLIFAPKAPSNSVTSTGNPAGLQSAAPAVPVTQPIAAGTGANPQSPQFASQTGETALSQPATVDAADLVRNVNGVQNIQTPPSANAIQETTFYINGAKPLDSYQIEEKDGSAAAKVVINIPKPSTAAVPDAPYESRPSAASRPAPKAETLSVPAVKSVTTRQPARPAATVKPANRPAAAAKPAAKTYDDYWVQTGAFSAKNNAENVKVTLADKGITSLIENREVNGKTWYRVRVGPYTSETEANYWLALVKGIDGFADSQVRQTRSIR